MHTVIAIERRFAAGQSESDVAIECVSAEILKDLPCLVRDCPV